MSRLVRWLWIALAVQILLVVWLSRGGVDLGAYASKEKLLGFEAGAFDKLIIQEKDGQPLTLLSKNGRWVLPDVYEFPAAPQKVGDLVNKLLALSKSWPVAATAIAAKQLKVSDAVFEKKISFLKGDKTEKVLYLGSAPTFRKVHVRLSGESPVYVVDFTSYDAAPKPEDWYDRQLLNLAKEKLTGLQLQGIAIEKKNGLFQPVGMNAEQEANEGEVNSLITKVTGINFETPIGIEEKPEFGLAEPALEVVLQKEDNQSVTLRFGKLKDAESYVLKSSTEPFFFKVGKDLVESLKSITNEKLVRPKGAPAAESQAQALGTPELPSDDAVASEGEAAVLEDPEMMIEQ